MSKKVSTSDVGARVIYFSDGRAVTVGELADQIGDVNYLAFGLSDAIELLMGRGLSYEEHSFLAVVQATLKAQLDILERIAPDIEEE